MDEWSSINSEFELDDYDREEYAFQIHCDEAHARARAKAERDFEHYKRTMEESRKVVEESLKVRLRRR